MRMVRRQLHGLPRLYLRRQIRLRRIKQRMPILVSKRQEQPWQIRRVVVRAAHGAIAGKGGKVAKRFAAEVQVSCGNARSPVTLWAVTPGR